LCLPTPSSLWDRASSVPSSAFNSLTDSLSTFILANVHIEYVVCPHVLESNKRIRPSTIGMLAYWLFWHSWYLNSSSETKKWAPPKTENRQCIVYTSGLTWPSTIIIASVMFGNLICWHDISWSTPMSSIHWHCLQEAWTWFHFDPHNIPIPTFQYIREIDWLLFFKTPCKSPTNCKITMSVAILERCW
jgi:hypothetical protein